MFSAKVMTERLNAILAELSLVHMSTVPDAELVPLGQALHALGEYRGFVDIEIHQRAVTEEKLLPGAIVETTVTHRAWEDKDSAEKLARESIGDAAFETKLKSVAQIEKLGPKGKALVAVAAYKPTGNKVARYL